MAKKPYLMTTTLWDFPSQQYEKETQGDKEYVGATPAYVIWNVLQRYSLPSDLVVDPMAGSGTTLDVARELGRRALGYDLQPTRDEISRCDARKLPLENEKADVVFVDPPYSTHVKYSGRPECIGELSAEEPAYYEAMGTVIEEIHRVLRPDRYMALYVCDSYRKKRPFCPIGFELFGLLRDRFEPVDIVAVVRHNKTLLRNHWHTAAMEGNYFLRGFNYLFIMYKPPHPGRKARKLTVDPSLPWGPNAKPAERKPGKPKRRGRGRRFEGR
jgi:DNA modification methylase